MFSMLTKHLISSFLSLASIKHRNKRLQGASGCLIVIQTVLTWDFAFLKLKIHAVTQFDALKKVGIGTWYLNIHHVHLFFCKIEETQS